MSGSGANSAAHVGASVHACRRQPAERNSVPDNSANGSDHYTDYAFDAGYQFLGDGTHIATVQTRLHA